MHKMVFRALSLIFFSSNVLSVTLYSRETLLTIHLRGVAESKVSLLIPDQRTFHPLLVKEYVKPDAPVTLSIDSIYLPGEFVLRFDFKENLGDTPYPSEKRILINNQNLELWVNPQFCNNPDSAWYQEGEKENKAYSTFILEIAGKKEMLGILQNLLINYDDTHSDFYRKAVKEYETRRQQVNQYIKDQANSYDSLFSSSLFGFEYVQKVEWEGSNADRKLSLRNNYFEGIDFKDPRILKSSLMTVWADNYVNLYGELATTNAQRDSLFTMAGKTAIEKARSGHSLVYGWMVDYFFNGYESFNIGEGIRMLEPYANDPDCPATRKQQIHKHLKGMESLIPGVKAPDIVLPGGDSSTFHLDTYASQKEYVLLFFWSADCAHCIETARNISAACQKPSFRERMDIIAISVDETEPEIAAWKKEKDEFGHWTHLLAGGSDRDKIMSDYFILGVPVMILLDSDRKEIIALPESVDELMNLFKSNPI